MVVELLAPGHIAPGVVHLAPPHRPLVAGLAGHVGLGPDDRIDPRLLAGGVEVEDAVHVPVIGDPESRLAVGGSRLDQIGDPGSPVQHRELGVRVQVGERRRGQRRKPSSVWLILGMADPRYG